jgi:hydrogenase maturation protease
VSFGQATSRGGAISSRADIVVIGVGNLLLRDEGIGVHLAHALEEQALPEGVQIVDAGTGGLNMLYAMERAKKVIFLDAAEMGKAPGAFVRFVPRDVKLCGAEHAVSFHELGLPQVLDLADALGVACEVVIFGVQPKDLSWGIGLSPELARAVPEILAAVAQEVRTCPVATEHP